MSFKYPAARRDTTTYQRCGTTVEDPYQWLEDPESPETKEFVKAQNEIFFPFVESWGASRDKLRQAVKDYFDYEKFSCPIRYGKWYFYFYNSGLQPQSIMYKTHSLDPTVKPEVLLDPNTIAADGTSALSTYAFTKSGSLMAYAISEKGSDWISIRVRNVADGSDLSDVLRWAKFTNLTWTHDEKGFIYNRYPTPSVDADKAGTETDANVHGKLYYHRVGTDQSEDTKIISDDDHPKWMFGSEVSDDGKYLIITVSESTDPVNKLYIAPIGEVFPPEGEIQWLKLVDNFEAEYSYITNEGTLFYFKTNKDAPHYKIVVCDIASGDKAFKDLVEETEVLDSVSCVNYNKLILLYIKDVKHIIKVHDLTSGKFLYDLDIPAGSIDSMNGRKEDSSIFYRFVSFTEPGRIIHHDLTTSKDNVFRSITLGGLDLSQFETHQEFYISKDGTKIPMFITHKKGLKRDGNSPTLLYGYGGFNISIMPMFSPTWMVWMYHLDGIVAVANIRGGGEFGETWHQGATRNKKQNCFDDFQYAAKHLIQEKYTTPAKLAINGGSNGGLLVGACVLQAPELFGAAIADVGVLDMLKFHKFTIGHAWMSEYGDPDNEEDFKSLVKYSPVHNVKPYSKLPAVLIVTGAHDDRVVPLHSYKFTAGLQYHNAYQDGVGPILMRVETKAGHGAGKPTMMRIEEAVDKYTFLALNLGASFH